MASTSPRTTSRKVRRACRERLQRLLQSGLVGREPASPYRWLAALIDSRALRRTILTRDARFAPARFAARLRFETLEARRVLAAAPVFLFEDVEASDIGAGEYSSGLTPTSETEVLTTAPGSDETAGLGLTLQEVQSSPTLQATLVDGTLRITDIAAEGVANRLSIILSGGDLVVTDAAGQFIEVPQGGALSNDNQTLSIALTAFTGLRIDLASGDDVLTVDFSSGSPISAGGLMFTGGDGSNALEVVGGEFATITQTYSLDHSSGAIDLDGALIDYRSLQSVLLEVGSVSDLEFQLPSDYPSGAILQDDGIVGNSLTQLGGGFPQPYFPTATFSNPTGSLSIQRGNAGDSLNVTSLPDFTSALEIGSDETAFSSVTFAGAVTLAPDRDLVAYAVGTISLGTSDSDLTVAGSGHVRLNAARNIALTSGSRIAAVDGDIVLTANQQAIATTGGPFVGVLLKGATLTTSGTGSIELTGRGGTSGQSNLGVSLEAGAITQSQGTGTVTLRGSGGESTGDHNSGVYLGGTNTQVSSQGGAVRVEGIGGGVGSSRSNLGVLVTGGATVTNLGSQPTASVTVVGTGGNVGGNSSANRGVSISGSQSLVSSSGGAVLVTGTGGGGGNGGLNQGVLIGGGAIVTSTDTLAPVTVRGVGGNIQGSDGDSNIGVYVLDAGSRITSGGGPVQVEGAGGGAGLSGQNFGVGLASGGVITSGSGNAGTVTVIGVGGNTTGTSGSPVSNRGVSLIDAGTQITSGGGAVLVQGAGGGGGSAWINEGVYVGTRAAITNTGVHPGATVTVIGQGGNLSGIGSVNTGVRVQGTQATITSSGGAVWVQGTGGGGEFSPNNDGVGVSNGGTITSAGTTSAATVTVRGFGGNAQGTGFTNHGVSVSLNGSRITSSGGAVLVEGVGGSGHSASLPTTGTHGVVVSNAGQITSAANASVTVRGTGGNRAGHSGNYNHGIWVADTGSRITSGPQGKVEWIGVPGGGSSSFGIQSLTPNTASASLAPATVILTADSVDLATPMAINAGTNEVRLQPLAASTMIDLGGNDLLTGSPLTLGLTAAELNPSIVTGKLTVGGSESGSITLRQNITRSTATDIQLVSGGAIIFDTGSIHTAGGELWLSPATEVQPKSSGVDVTASLVAMAPDSTLRIEIEGSVVDAQYWQLNVAGQIDLSGVNLQLSGSPTLFGGETFTIVNNGGTAPIIGEFKGLAEGAVINNFLDSGRDATITYRGGDGNDVVLSVEDHTELFVTTLDDVIDSEDGELSLREAVIQANATPGHQTIFLPAGTLTLAIAGRGENAAATGDLDLTDDVTIQGAGREATTIDAGGIDRVFDIGLDVTAGFRGLTLTGGAADRGADGPILENDGGALRIDFFGTVTIAESNLHGNSASGSGGALRNDGQLTIVNSVLENNTAVNTGGAIYVGAGEGTTLVGSTLRGNTAREGGAIFNHRLLLVRDSTLSGNSASLSGGAINNNEGGELWLLHSTLSGNAAGGFQDGGAIINFETAEVVGSTIANNTAGFGGGFSQISGVVWFENTIIANNTGIVTDPSGASYAPDVAGTIYSMGYNLVSEPTGSMGFGSSGDLLNVDPRLGPLADNGGATPTHALLAGSPAIDGGNTHFVPNRYDPPLTEDQRGFVRVRDGNGDAAPRLDIGAYELQTPYQISVTTFDDVLDPADGLTSLREAVIAANGSDVDVTILLSTGTYTLSRVGSSENAAFTGDLDILGGSSVTIVGAGSNDTIIDASGLAGVTSPFRDRVFDVLAGGTLNLQALTVTGGYVDGSGGGILNAGQLHLQSVAVTGNAATASGGGIRNTGTLVIDASEISDNTVELASGTGGGISHVSTDLQISASTFANNTAHYGGGIWSNAATTIVDSSLSGNRAFIDQGAGDGGAIYQVAGTLSLSGSTLADNQAVFGGGISSRAATTITGSTFTGNTATANGGGIILATGGAMTLKDSTLANNTANFGGGLLNTGSAEVINSTFSFNHARNGGGGISSTESWGTLIVRHSTFYGNRADADGNGSGTGGGVRRGDGTITLQNTIVAGNVRGPGNTADDITGPLTAGSAFNLVGDSATAGGLVHGASGNLVGNEGVGTLAANLVLDPILADNGGLTWTHALVAGSPAIDAGDPSFNPSASNPPLVADQRGLTRVVDGRGVGTARLDIGAYELQQPFPLSELVVTTFADTLDPSDGQLSLREAVILANQQANDVTIILAAGTYRLTLQGAEENAAMTGDLDILAAAHVTIAGAGAEQTTIDAGGLNDRIFHVLVGAELNLEGLTLSGGVAPNALEGAERTGGAILNAGTLGVTASTIAGNSSAIRGGGIGNAASGTAVITGSTISGNSAGMGGGIDNFGQMTLTDTLLTENSASDGGAIYNSGPGSNLLINGSTIIGNSADFGAGISAVVGRVNIHASNIAENSPNSSENTGGGGIYNVNAMISLTSSMVVENTASVGGGILNTGQMRIAGSTIAGNLATVAFGGGIASVGMLTLINSTVSGNSAIQGGGGIVGDSGTINVLHSTIFGNRVDAAGSGAGTGGGILILSGGLMLQHSIVAGNVRGPGAGIADDVSGTVNPTSSYNLISTGGSGGLIDGAAGNLVGIEPAVVLDPELKDNGGPTLSHALLSGSPAIDAGNPSFNPNTFDPPLLFDQRGQDFDRVLAGRIDLGAFEWEFIAPPAGIAVSLPGGSDTLSVAEFGSVAQRQTSFGVALTAPPTSDVVLRITKTNQAELTFSTTTLTFTPENWDVPQEVTVEGVNDNVAGPDRTVLVILSVDSELSDPAYVAVAPQTFQVLVHDVPEAPTITVPSGVASNPVSIEFSNSSGATSYNLWFVNLDTGALVESRTDIPAGDTIVALANPLLPPGSYRAYISANNNHGFSGWAVRDFSIDVAAVPPVAPTISGVQTTENPQQPQMNWNVSTGATGYDVWLVRLADGTLAGSARVVTNSFIPSADLVAGRYRLLVRGINGMGMSGWSAPYDFDIGAPATRPDPPVVTGTTLNGNPMTPQVDWNASPGATYYDTWLVNLASGAMVASARVLEAFFTPEADLVAGRYRMLVRAGNAMGLSGWSAPYDFDVGAPATRPEPPVLTGTTENGNPLAPQVNWNVSPGAAYYDTWLVNLASGAMVASARVVEAFFIPELDLAAGRYRMLVRAGNAMGLSGWGAPLDFSVNSPVTAPPAPLAHPPSGTETLRPTLQWTAVAGATSYAIWLVNLVDGALVTSVSAIATNSFALSVDLPAGNYRYFVRASNAVGTSPWSAPQDFSTTSAAGLSGLMAGGPADDDDDEQQLLAAVDAAIVLLAN